MEAVAQQLSAAFAAGFVSQATCEGLLEHFPDAKMMRLSAQLTLISTYMAVHLAGDSQQTVSNVGTYFMPYLGITGVRRACSCGCQQQASARFMNARHHRKDSGGREPGGGGSGGGSGGGGDNGNWRGDGCSDGDQGPSGGDGSGSSPATADDAGTRSSLETSATTPAPPRLPEQDTPQRPGIPGGPAQQALQLQPLFTAFAMPQLGGSDLPSSSNQHAMAPEDSASAQLRHALNRASRAKLLASAAVVPRSADPPLGSKGCCGQQAQQPILSTHGMAIPSGSLPPPSAGSVLGCADAQRAQRGQHSSSHSQVSSKSSSGALSVIDIPEMRHRLSMTFINRQLEAKYLLWVAGHHVKADIMAALVLLVMYMVADVNIHLSRKTGYLFSLSYLVILSPLLAMASDIKWYVRHREVGMVAIMMTTMLLSGQVLWPALLRDLLAKPLPRSRLLTSLSHVPRLTGAEAMATLPLFYMVRFKTFLWLQPILWLLALVHLPAIMAEFRAGSAAPAYLLPAAALVQACLGVLLPAALIRFAEQRSRRLFLQWAHTA